MAQYTTLTRQEIETIAADFSIQNINSYSVLSGGSENTNYVLKTEKGNYVLTICEQKTGEKATELAHLLEYFQKHHFKSSIIVRNAQNEPIGFWGKKPLMMKKFLEGKVIDDLPNHLLELIGIEIGKLHKVKAPNDLQTLLPVGKEQFGKVKEYAPGSAFELWLNETLAYVLPYFKADLPRALNHTDIFSNNVIISDDETAVTIMDFEEATNYYRIFDIGMTIIGSCSNDQRINHEKVKHLLIGYTKEIELLDIEIDALQAFTVYAGATMTFWRHLNFNHTIPTPDLFDHYLGLQALTDEMKAQPADYFHKMIEEITS